MIEQVFVGYTGARRAAYYRCGHQTTLSHERGGIKGHVVVGLDRCVGDRRVGRALSRGTTNPKSDAEFVYGRPMKGHSWHVEPWAAFVKRIADAIRANAPAGENTAAWNY